MQYVEHVFSGTTGTTYNSSQATLIGDVRQYTGSYAVDKYVAPPPILGDSVGERGTFNGTCADVLRVTPTSNKYWIFVIDNTSTSGNSRKLQLYELNDSTWTLTYVGRVSLAVGPTPNMASTFVSSLKVTLDHYTAGTISGSNGSATLTGDGTLWTDSHLVPGSRLGIGSTDPDQIVSWTVIGSVGSNTSITLSGALNADVPAGTPYVIQDLRAYYACNVNSNTSGLLVAKGLAYSSFVNADTSSIGQAGATDNLPLVYWLALNPDAVLGAMGLVVDARTSWNDQSAYVVSYVGADTMKIHKFNVRAALTVSSGKTTSAFVLSTGTILVDHAVSPTAAVAENRATLCTSPTTGEGKKLIYIATSKNCYAFNPSSISSGSGLVELHEHNENQPGGFFFVPANFTSTHTTNSHKFGAVHYISSLDRFVFNSHLRQNISRLQPSGLTVLETVGGFMDGGIDPAAADAGKPKWSSHTNTGYTRITASDKHLITIKYWDTTGTNSNQLYVIPVCAHEAFNTTYCITPKIATPFATKLKKAVVSKSSFVGSGIYEVETNPISIYARTAGIDDNTGSWTKLDNFSLSLANLACSGYIQFKITWDAFSARMIASKVFNIGVVYDDEPYLPYQFTWSKADSALTGQIGFKQRAVLGVTPAFKIQYYRLDNSLLLLEQTSAGNTYGQFQYLNGETWTNGVGPDTIGTRRIFIPTAGITSGIEVYTKLILI